MASRRRRTWSLVVAGILLGGAALYFWQQPVEEAPKHKPRPETTETHPESEAPTVAMVRLGSIVGVVASAEAQPVAGAVVSVIAQAGDFAQSLESDATGRFTLGGLTEGMYSVVATKGALVSDRESVTVRAVDIAAQVLLKLEPGASLAGSVRDAADGSELSACQIQTGPKSITTCDHAGRFVIGPLAPGQLSMVVSAPGYAPKQLSVELPTRTRIRADVSLSRGGMVTGTVFNTAHQPYPGATVRSSHYSMDGIPATEVSALSDGKGHFVLDGVAPGRARFLATAPGYAESEGVELLVAGGGRTDGVELVLTTGGAIIGTISDVAGKGVQNAQIQALRLVDKRVLASSASVGDGSYRLDGLTPGRYTVLGSLNGLQAISSNVSVTAREETTVNLMLGSDAIDGRVASSNGEPVPGAAVTVFSAYASGTGGQVALTNAEGKFRIEGLVGAPYRVEAHAEKLGSTERRGVAAGDHLELVLAGVGRIAGVVTDSAGHAIETYEVRLVPKDESLTGGVSNRYQVQHVVAPNGSFRFDEVPVGKYAVRAKDATHFDAEAGADVTAGATTDVTLTLRDGATINGTVMHDGVPVVGCSVRPSSDPAISDSAGAFTLRGIQPNEKDHGVMVDATCPNSMVAWDVAHVDPGGVGEITLQTVPATGARADVASQDFGGIGASLMSRNGAIGIGYVYEGSPAFLAGILAGDVVQSVDGWSTTSAAVEDVIGRIRGPIGTPVTLGIQRGSQSFQAVAERSRIVPN